MEKIDALLSDKYIKLSFIVFISYFFQKYGKLRGQIFILKTISGSKFA